MRIRFWGVRGSIPTPLTSQALQSKISAVVQRISEKDIETPESRERFLAGLPSELFSTVGGNTSCVEVQARDSERIIFDAGTGIRDLGRQIESAQGCVCCHIFFSHFHWDHLQGLPFFAPAFNPSSSIRFYSPEPALKQILAGQMRHPYFPVTLEAMRAHLDFIQVGEEGVRVESARILPRRMNHPGGCWSYCVISEGKRVIYSTDTELQPVDFERNSRNAAFFRDADALIIDAQYTLGEAIEKYNWGHSSFSLAADFASSWGIKRLILFHHDPSYDDRKIQKLVRSAEWYVARLESKGLEVILAREGLTVEV